MLLVGINTSQCACLDIKFQYFQTFTCCCIMIIGIINDVECISNKMDRDVVQLLFFR
jgi:hypothetical protein